MYKYLHIYTQVHTHKLYSLVFWHSHLLMWVCVCVYVCVCVCVYTYTWASQVALAIKNLPAIAGDARIMCLIPGLGRFPWRRASNLLQSSCPEDPVDRGDWWATVHWVTVSQTQLKQLCIHIHTYIYICVCVCVYIYIYRERERERWREWELVYCDAYVPLGFIPIPKIHKSRVE